MGLASRLFKGNQKLESCLVDNAAHVTLGARGEHVAKIQYALFALDSLIIDRQELLTNTYGRSSAAAVLSYKTRRGIINRSYQNTPDNIVGKMTIASLDDEMRKLEFSFNAPGECLLSPPGVSTSSGGDLVGASSLAGFNQTHRHAHGFAATGVGQSGNGTPKQLNRALRVYCAITSKASLEDGFPLAAHFERTKDSLFEHGLTLSVEMRNGFADTINFPDRIVLDEDIVRLRKASEDTRPGLRGILRVIVCPMNDFEFGETYRNRRIGNLLFPPFVLMNSRQTDRSSATLLHEMIHAANNGPIQHDSERNSIFFEFGSTQAGSVERTTLRPEHAAKLATAFFAI